MKYYFYISKKIGLIKFYDKAGTNKVDPEKFEIKGINLTKAEEKSLDTFGHKKIINNKLVIEEPHEVIKKREIREKIKKATKVEDIKQILFDIYG